MRQWEMALTNGNGSRPPAIAVLEELRKQEPLLAEAREALERPVARWPMTPLDGSSQHFNYLSALLRLALFLQLKGVAQLDAGQGDAALDTIQLSFRISWAIGQENVLINYLTEVAVDRVALSPVIVGLRKHIWNDDQLARLQGIIAGEPALSRFQTSMRGERAFGLSSINRGWKGWLRIAWKMPEPIESRLWLTLWAFRPSGWDRLESAHYAANVQHLLIDTVDTERGIIDVARVKRFHVRQGWLSSSRMSDVASLVFADAAQKASSCQAFLNEALTACALERYCLRNGRLPDSTLSLVPDFLPALPVDPVTGKPLSYIRKEEGDYLLYSVAWDEKDDGGIIVRPPGLGQGDWVWASRPDLSKFVDGKAPETP